MPVVPATWEAEVGRLWSKASLRKKQTLPEEKQTKTKRDGVVTPVVDCLPQKCKALSLIPSTTKNKNGNNK
jgi:hypothetical protein